MGKKRIMQKLRWLTIIDGNKRAKWLSRKKILKGIGNNCLWQSRKFPMDPECILIHDNVTIAADVTFVTHDAIRHVLMYKYNKRFPKKVGCIEVMDNVFIGIGSIIMPNVRINSNVVVAAGSVVTKDIPENSVVAGVSARIIGNFDELVKKREYNSITNSSDCLEDKEKNNLWDDFYNTRSV